MAKYKKESPRLEIKVYDRNDMSEPLFTVPNRDVLDIGNFLSDSYMTNICNERGVNHNEILAIVAVIYDKID